MTHALATSQSQAPLAERLRPKRFQDVVGQQHLLGENKPFRGLFEKKRLHSLILWGPPGTGKTTLARLLADNSGAQFHTLSAVTSGVKEIRQAIAVASETRRLGQDFILFVDEVHRFNKSQQDGFLPHIEDGTIIFIGATTENPSFELNRALLSRLRVFVLEPLSDDDIRCLLERAVDVLAMEHEGLTVEPGSIDLLATLAAGDARQALTVLEMAITLAGTQAAVSEEHIRQATGRRAVLADKQGDAFYDLISAFHKAVRGSNPDAALYWLARMLEGGIAPDYVARRLQRIASEDIGNADPRAITIAGDAWDSWRRLGSPEGELAIAQATVFLACAAKSNAVYQAWGSARKLATDTAHLPIPVHLRNAPTKLAKSLGHGAQYRYDHDEQGGFAAGQTYFPEELGEKTLYHPVDRGLETRIGEKLVALRGQSQLQKTRG